MGGSSWEAWTPPEHEDSIKPRNSKHWRDCLVGWNEFAVGGDMEEVMLPHSLLLALHGKAEPTDRQRDRDRETEAPRHRETARQRHTERQTDRQTDRQAGRQADRQTDRQTDRHTQTGGERERERYKQIDRLGHIGNTAGMCYMWASMDMRAGSARLFLFFFYPDAMGVLEGCPPACWASDGRPCCFFFVIN